MFSELIRAFFFIFVAEMGDKTQIMAMTFATKYRVEKVLLGVLIGSALNHGIAIALGSYLSNLIPLNTVQMIAGFLFVIFGLWTLKTDEEEEEDGTKNRFGPVLTVAMAFFIGELGDKTQLTAMTLATDAQYPIFILFGTVMGMIVTSGLGIFVGSKLGAKIPELGIKIGSGAVFIFFGTLKLFQTVPREYISPFYGILYFIILGSVVFVLMKKVLEQRQDNRVTALREVATTLYIQTHELKKAIDNICLGEEKCGMCKNKECLIGFTKEILENVTKDENFVLSKLERLPEYEEKGFDEDKIVKALSMTIAYYLNYGFEHEENNVINKTRQALEKILFGEKISFNGDIHDYFKILKKKDINLANKIIESVKIMRNKED